MIKGKIKEQILFWQGFGVDTICNLKKQNAPNKLGIELIKLENKEIKWWKKT